MELTDVKGVGPSAARKLRTAGIDTVAALASLDLRATKVEGLSSENLANLRGNAGRFIAAQEVSDLTLVEGVGISAATKLAAHGVITIEDLANLDLRRERIEGLSTENLQRLKRNARYLQKNDA